MTFKHKMSVFQEPQAQGESFWHDERRAALRGEANYATAVGAGYPQVPRAKAAAGFSTPNLALADAYPRAARANLPQRREYLYAPHAGFACDYEPGYFIDHEANILEVAPDRPKAKDRNLGRIASCAAGMKQLPYGEDFSHGKAVDFGMSNIDMGAVWAPGFITDAPAPKVHPHRPSAQEVVNSGECVLL